MLTVSQRNRALSSAYDELFSRFFDAYLSEGHSREEAELLARQEARATAPSHIDDYVEHG